MPNRSFNPHSHTGSDSGAFYPIVHTDVSIHTPTRGVTWCCQMLSNPSVVSIHTPTRGVTRVGTQKYRKKYVSIHTPTRGVTCCRQLITFHLSFNPHSHTGSDFQFAWTDDIVLVSIHTPTRGVTQYARPLTWGILFQSTLPHGE